MPTATAAQSPPSAAAAAAEVAAPRVFYRIQSNESNTIFDPSRRSFYSRLSENPYVLFDGNAQSFPRLVAYLKSHLNNFKLFSPFISVDASKHSALRRAKHAVTIGRTGIFVAEIVPTEGMYFWDARQLATQVDACTAPKWKTINPGNWYLTENEWLAINYIPGEAVRRIWTVKEFE